MAWLTNMLKKAGSELDSWTENINLQLPPDYYFLKAAAVGGDVPIVAAVPRPDLIEKVASGELAPPPGQTAEEYVAAQTSAARNAITISPPSAADLMAPTKTKQALWIGGAVVLGILALIALSATGNKSGAVVVVK